MNVTGIWQEGDFTELPHARGVSLFDDTESVAGDDDTFKVITNLIRYLEWIQKSVTYVSGS